MEYLTWILIAVCISQSAMFSGLNIAFFSISKLRLEIEATQNNRQAIKVQKFRKDSNFLLVTILWGNVGVNVLLSLLSGSVLAGVLAFIFSTVLITIAGEIIPQAYFSRNALKMASLLSPLLRFYQVILFPIAKPTAFLLDRWLGKEAITFFKEGDFRELVRRHIEANDTDMGEIEGQGVLNFLKFDDLLLGEEGEIIDSRSIISLDFRNDKPVFPQVTSSSEDEFLKRLNASGKRWVIVTDSDNVPRSIIDADGFIRGIIFDQAKFSPHSHCYHPIILNQKNIKLADVLPRLKVDATKKGDDVIDNDIIILWEKEKRIITGSDILGRLLRGIVQNKPVRKK
jgi:metal transporter CNNM